MSSSGSAMTAMSCPTGTPSPSPTRILRRPPEPNASDRAWLRLLGQVIDLAHKRYDMAVSMVVCPNTIGNERSAGYEFATRPYFVCEWKINPADPAQVRIFLEGRRRQLEPLAGADSLAVIDSDPGGYIGSTNPEFVELMAQQMGVFRSFHAGAELIYWMLFGWERYNLFWAETQRTGNLSALFTQYDKNDFAETLSGMKSRIAEPWSVFASTPQHNAALDALDLRSKAMWYPYGVIEGEPTFPFTNCGPARLAEKLTPEGFAAYPRGAMANSQTHCLQVPGACIYAHLAQGGTLASLDLASYAERMLPGLGEPIAKAWSLLESGEGGAIRSAAADLRAAAHPPYRQGPLSGLLFGDAQRFLDDLLTNLSLRAALVDLAAAAGSAALPRALRAVLDVLGPYDQRLGFLDAYGGPFFDAFNKPLGALGDAALGAVLQQFHDWRDPAIRNGVVPRLLAAADEYCRRHGA